ncbi:MAG: phenylacetate-CoA oxygenase subunit PaaC [Gammaproteobacteria bacterium]|nr:phenylacetate-CoA oxygenase subunit PaaC [Gammaproteobacteria bacterium]
MSDDKALNTYILRLADNGLVLGQRLCEWCANAPVLEEETAIMNTSLDLFGQARNWLNYAVEHDANLQDCDAVTMLRDERAYLNLLLVEQANGNFAETMARQYLFDTWHRLTLEALCNSTDATIAAIAAKSVLEVRYHEQRSRNWILRLGDGTPLSHQRMQTAIDDLWTYVDEMFSLDDLEQNLVAKGIAADQSIIAPQWHTLVANTITKATLQVPTNDYNQIKNKQGLHSEGLGIMLAEMQSLYRAHPGATW